MYRSKMSKNSTRGSYLRKTPTRKIIRNPKCARCRNHGFVVQLKGHAGKCPFFPCECWKCSLVTERTKIMAIQRHMGKSPEEEFLPSVESSLGELQSLADGSVEDIDVINNSATESDSDGVPQSDSTAEQRPRSSRSTESVIKVPLARRIEADGKTYTELITVMSPNGATADTADVQDHMAQAPATHGGGPAASTELNREGLLYCAPPQWTTMQDNGFMMGRPTPHFPGEYVIAAVAQRNPFSGEWMTVPFPIKLYPPYPNSYGCPAFLLNMPPPGPVPGPYRDPHMGFPNFHSSTVPYVPEPGPAQEFHSLFRPPLSAQPVSPHEEPIFNHLPHPNLHRPREQGEGNQGNGSRRSDINGVEDQSTSQETM